MMKKALWAFTLVGIMNGPSYGEDPKVERKPLNIGGAAEFGPVVRGLYDASRGAKGAEEKRGEWVDHFLAYFNHEVVVEDRLHITAGLGGVFQFRKPEKPGLGFPSDQRKAFFIGPSKTEAVYHFGELEKPWLKLGIGMFPYKYNPEAANLGEYLFRSSAYPTFVRTGGYLVVNSAGAQLQGFKANFQKGNFKADLFLVTETTLAPLYDWSLGGVLEYSMGDGLFTIGGGVNFQHLLQVRPSRSALKTDVNSYFTYNNVEYTGSTEYYSFRSDYYANHAKVFEDQAAVYQNDTIASNDALIPGLLAEAQKIRVEKVAPDSLTALLVDSLLKDSLARPQLGLDHFTSAGVLVMGRATLDIKKLFPNSEIFGAEDLKIYGETCILGVQNYPVFYKEITDRIPIMVGFNFPGFKILDLIAIQAEYFNSPWANNSFMRGYSQGGNIPYFPMPSDKVMSEETYYDASGKDNYKWSVLVKKNLLRNVSFSAQVASDHLNLVSSTYYYGPQFDPGEITAFKDHWYWMGQLSWGI
jgi:hypothetical protein